LIKTFLQQKEPHIIMMRMRKSIALLLVLVFLTAPYLMAMPARSSTASTNVTENTWVTKTPMHQARGFLGVAAVNGKIYAIGGNVLVYQDKLRTESKAVGTNEEYDPETDTWTFKTPMPTPSSGFATAVYQGKIYCLGSGKNQVYNPATDEWENKTSTSIPIAQANVVNGKIYVIGGYPNNTLNEVYDPATDTWTTKAPAPKVAAAASGVLDNKIYSIGGYFDGGYISVTQIYDPLNDLWSIGSPPPTYFVGGSAGAVTTGVMASKRLYVFDSPYGDMAAMPNDPLYTNQVYDPKNDNWVAGVGIPTNREYFGVAVVDDIIYVIGGFSMTFPSMLSVYKSPSITYYATNEQYTPFGYGSPDPTYDGTVPEFAVVSPANMTYYTAGGGVNFTDVALNFKVDEPVFSVRYRLDGRVPVEVSGNVTLEGLAVGGHNVTVFGFDSSGNMGVSETVFFAIAEPEPFPTVLVATAAVATIAVVSVALLVYFKKRKH
jgi:N-acetylneuraminic acid mutarotase